MFPTERILPIRAEAYLLSRGLPKESLKWYDTVGVHAAGDANYYSTPPKSPVQFLAAEVPEGTEVVVDYTVYPAGQHSYFSVTGTALIPRTRPNDEAAGIE